MALPLTTPISGRSVWTAAELEGDPHWRHALTARQRDDIRQATVAVRDAGSEGHTVTLPRFPLPALVDDLERLAKELEDGRGVVVLRGLPVDDYDDAALRLAYHGIMSHFGTAISQNSKGQHLAEVSDRGNDLRETNTRGYSTRARLGPHSDMCDMTSLLCVHTARSGGESQIASAMSVFNHILTKHPEHLPILFGGFHHDLRGEGPTAAIDEVTAHQVPVFCYHAGRLSCGFNPKISENGMAKRGKPFTDTDRAALDAVSEAAARPELSHAMWLERGDIQIINNHAVLHSRNAFVDGDDPGRRRKLYRMWLRPHRLRLLPDEFTDRYNTGPHGGVAVGDGARYAF